jgi:hypothetical protein
MRLFVVALLTALALIGCASTGGGKLAVCDGKHLRAANPYGSVLAPATSGEALTPRAAAGEAKPRKLSSAASSSSFGSCA